MDTASQWLLVAGVVAVGALHTVVPDHWLPITILARQQGWSRGETARAAARAGFGHVMSTLLLGLVVWLGGAALAESFGAVVDLASSAALVAFGGWIALSAWRELHEAGDGHHHHAHDEHHHARNDGHRHAHGHHHHGAERHRETEEWDGDPLYLPVGGAAAVLARHCHIHRHGGGAPHIHWHDHVRDTVHEILSAFDADPPPHRHRHRTSARMMVVLILGSSPMVEGVPAFFAAGRYGAALIAAMAAAFAASTIATYVALCVGSTAGAQRLRFGKLERYGEVLSGAFIAAIGLAFGIAAAV
jgi:hypothetical protein